MSEVEHVPGERPAELARNVGSTLAALRLLVDLDARDRALPAEATEAEREAYRLTLARAAEALTSLRASDVAAAMIVGGVQGEASLVMWNQARRALYSLAPVVVMRLAQKLDDADAPGSVRILSEVAKGLGLLVPGAGMTDKQREKEIAKRSLSELTEAELDARLSELRGEEE